MILRFIIALLLLVAASVGAEAAESVRVIKVLHLLIDAQGRNALAPSLFERDAYQVHLREHPELIASSRFDIQYKARRHDGPVRLRLEIRGSKTGLGNARVFETEALPDRWGSSWAHINLDKPASDAIGTIVAWRATLLRDGVEIAQQQSFLW
jgi:hypothetical protein